MACVTSYCHCHRNCTIWRPSHQSTIVSSRSSSRAEIRFETPIDAGGKPTGRRAGPMGNGISIEWKWRSKLDTCTLRGMHTSSANRCLWQMSVSACSPTWSVNFGCNIRHALTPCPTRYRTTRDNDNAVPVLATRFRHRFHGLILYGLRICF